MPSDRRWQLVAMANEQTPHTAGNAADTCVGVDKTHLHSHGIAGELRMRSTTIVYCNTSAAEGGTSLT